MGPPIARPAFEALDEVSVRPCTAGPILNYLMGPDGSFDLRIVLGYLDDVGDKKEKRRPQTEDGLQETRLAQHLTRKLGFKETPLAQLQPHQLPVQLHNLLVSQPDVQPYLRILRRELSTSTIENPKYAYVTLIRSSESSDHYENVYGSARATGTNERGRMTPEQAARSRAARKVLLAQSPELKPDAIVYLGHARNGRGLTNGVVPIPEKPPVGSNEYFSHDYARTVNRTDEFTRALARSPDKPALVFLGACSTESHYGPQVRRACTPFVQPGSPPPTQPLVVTTSRSTYRSETDGDESLDAFLSVFDSIMGGADDLNQLESAAQSCEHRDVDYADAKGRRGVPAFLFRHVAPRTLTQTESTLGNVFGAAHFRRAPEFRPPSEPELPVDERRVPR